MGETLQFMQRLWELVHALDVRSKRMSRAYGVTGPQRLVVRIIGQSPDVSASRIALILGMHPSTLTGVLARLQRRGAIRRIMDPRDKRRTRFTLTALGRKIDRQRRGTVESAVRRALARTEDHDVEYALRVLGLLVEELFRA